MIQPAYVTASESQRTAIVRLQQCYCGAPVARILGLKGRKGPG